MGVLGADSRLQLDQQFHADADRPVRDYSNAAREQLAWGQTGDTIGRATAIPIQRNLSVVETAICTLRKICAQNQSHSSAYEMRRELLEGLVAVRSCRAVD